MKIHLVASNEEKYSTKKTKMNIALKYSKQEDYVSVIIFKSFLEVILIFFITPRLAFPIPGSVPGKVLQAVCENNTDRKKQRFNFQEGLVLQQQENL